MGVIAHEFHPVGNDGAIIQFLTPSRSRRLTHPGHEVTYYFDGSKLHCSCEDSVCRMKNYKSVYDEGHCDHNLGWKVYVWPIIARALRLPIERPAQAKETKQ